MLNEKAIIVFGEVLYDCFPDGKQVLGGAPFNVAWGVRGFGLHPTLVSAVGDDQEGRALLTEMQAWGLDTSGMQTHPQYHTGKVNITLADGDASYDICAPRAWDFIEDQALQATQLLYHGSLALRSPASRDTFALIAERSANSIRFFDINLRAPHYDLEVVKKWIQGTDWLKLNLTELEAITGHQDLNFEGATAVLPQLKERYAVGNILLTGGSAGATIFGDHGQAVCAPAPAPSAVVDTVGAGDSFSALTIRGIIQQIPAQKIVQQASAFAAKVCQMRGATTQSREFYQI